MTSKRKRRHWSDEEKRTVCRQARQPGISVAQVAQRYSMNANLVFKWLRDPRFAPDETVAEEPVFLPVEVAPDRPASEKPMREMALAQVACDPGQDQPSSRSMEIILANGHRIRVDGEFDGDGLARLLKGLVS